MQDSLNSLDEEAPSTAGVDDDSVLGTISVLTLNVWVNKAQENIHRQVVGIRKLKPDVICLQEVFHIGVLEGYRANFPDYHLMAFGKGFSFNATAILLICYIILSGLVWAWLVWVLLRVSGHFMKEWLLLIPFSTLIVFWWTRKNYLYPFLLGNRTGLVLLVRRCAELEIDSEWQSCVMFSPKEGHQADILNILRPRGFIMALGRLRLKNDQHLPVKFCTTHLNQPPIQAPGVGRHQQIKELVAALCKKDGSLCICGADLNAPPPGTDNGTTCTTYQDMCLHFNDAWLAHHECPDPNVDGLTWDQQENPMCITATNAVFYGAECLRWRCDYIMWSYKSEDVADTAKRVAISVRSCDIVLDKEDSVSDHYGVLAVFDVKRLENKRIFSTVTFEGRPSSRPWQRPSLGQALHNLARASRVAWELQEV